MEAALAVSALLALLVLCIGALAAVGAQIRCIDAAREAARLAARGDGPSVAAAVRAVGPRGAEVRIQRDDDVVRATVRLAAPLVPGLQISADAVAAVEPGG